jgi:hypothetical protein
MLAGRSRFHRSGGQHAQFEGVASEHEREFTDLRQIETGQRRNSQRAARQPDGECRHDSLCQERDQGDRGNQSEMLERDCRNEEHAQRDEEQAREQVPERSHLCMDLVAELAAGQHEAGQERAEGHRQAQRRTGRGGPDAGYEHCQSEGLALTRAGDEPQQHRQRVPADDGHASERQQRAAEHTRNRRRLHRPRDHRGGQQEENDAQILEEQDAGGHAPGGSIEPVAPAELLEDDRRARQCQKQAGEHARAQPDAERPARGAC